MSSAFDEIGLTYGVTDELESLQNTLSSIRARLLDADEKKETSHSVQDWIVKLRVVVFEMDDVVDAFGTQALHQKPVTPTKKVLQCFTSSNPIVFRNNMAHEIKNIRKKLDDIAEDMSKFNFSVRPIDAPVESRVEREETHSFVLESEVIGREGDKEKLIDSLTCCNDQEDVTIFAIVGIGGLGKTTLAQFVYNDKRTVEHFNLRIWVCVSDPFGLKIIVENLVKSATLSDPGNLGLDQLQLKLRQELNDKKFLIVLDDVWSEDGAKWDQLKSLLMGRFKRKPYCGNYSFPESCIGYGHGLSACFGRPTEGHGLDAF